MYIVFILDTSSVYNLIPDITSVSNTTVIGFDQYLQYNAFLHMPIVYSPILDMTGVYKTVLDLTSIYSIIHFLK